MRAGLLRHRISLQSKTSVPDAAGQPMPTWTTFAAGVPARFEAVTGGEIIRGRQVVAEATSVLTIRYRSDLTPECRVLVEGRTLGIVAVSDLLGTRRELRVECKEVK